MPSIKDFLLRQAEGKALAPHRFFTDDSPLSVYMPGQSPNRERGVISQREAKHHLQAYGGSEAMDWVMSCVSLYSEPAGTAPFHLERAGKKYVLDRTDDNTDAPLADQTLVKLLRKPNPLMTYNDLIELMVIDLLLVGNAYWYKFNPDDEGRPFELWRMSPSDVKIKPGQRGIDRYEYAPSGVKDPLKIDPSQVIHFKRPNPHNPYYGLGVIKGAGRAADIDLALTDTQAWYFENRADPSLIVQSERRVPRDVFKKLRAQLRARASGPHNAGELLVLEAGLKAETLSPSAREAMFKDLGDASRDRVLSWFKVNPKLLGVAEVGTAGDKVQDARREFDNKQLRPFMDKLQAKVSLELTSLWDYDFKIDYRYIMPQEDLVKLSGDFSSIPGVKVREVRRFLVEGGILDEESTGDDEIDEMVLNLPGEELDEDGQGGFADRPLPGEPGRPPKGENTKKFPRGARVRQGKSLKSMDQILAELKELPETKAVEFEPRENVSVGNKLTGEQRPDDRLLDPRTADTDAIIGSMQSDILDAAVALERELLDHVEGKAFDPKTTLARIGKSEAWTTFRNSLRDALMRGAQQSISASAVHHASVGIDPGDDLDYEQIAESVINRPEGLRGIVNNLKQQMLTKIADALDAGRTSTEAAVRETIGFWRDNKAETIAMTEAVEAYNEGTLTLAESRGEAEVFVEDGHDHDEACAEADGSIWTVEQARKNRTEHPRCRRSFTLLGSEA
jgi:HK97 family phage portal protein